MVEPIVPPKEIQKELLEILLPIAKRIIEERRINRENS